MRIGILGGSFDPIHRGHINMASCACTEFGLDKVILMPAAHSPNKDEHAMTSFDARYEMCYLAAEAYDYIEASDFENTFNERSYTYKTLTRYKELHPDDDLYFIMGGDSLDYFDKWYHPEIIASKCTILVVVREGFDREQMEAKIQAIGRLFPCRISLCSCQKFDAASSEIRDIIRYESAESSKLDKLLDPKVRKYISDNNLYRKIY